MRDRTIKRFIMGVLFLYPALELSRLIVLYPHWSYLDYRPIVELVFIWSCFFAGIWISTKNIKHFSKKDERTVKRILNKMGYM